MLDWKMFNRCEIQSFKSGNKVIRRGVRVRLHVSAHVRVTGSLTGFPLFSPTSYRCEHLPACLLPWMTRATTNSSWSSRVTKSQSQREQLSFWGNIYTKCSVSNPEAWSMKLKLERRVDMTKCACVHILTLLLWEEAHKHGFPMLSTKCIYTNCTEETI